MTIVQIVTEEIKDGYRYTTYSNGTAVKEIETAKTVELEELNDIQPTNGELIQAELLLSQQKIIAKQESIDETLAALLLSQQK